MYSVHLPVLVREKGAPGEVLDEREHALTMRFDVKAESAEAAARLICDRMREVLDDKYCD